MNNFYKTIRVAAVMVVAAIALVGCKQDGMDINESNRQLAQKGLVGTYVYVDVDSVQMSTTLHEWNLTEKADARTGYYRLVATGNGLDRDSSVTLTWEPAVMGENYLYVTVPVMMETDVQKDLIWANGVVNVDGYETEKFLISEATVLRKLHDSFKDLTFEVNDTTPAIFLDRAIIKYLVWNTEQRKNVTVDSVNAYNEYLKQYKDTIAWYNEKFKESIPDTVKGKPNAQGIYKVAIFPVCSEKKETVTDTIKYGPAKIVTGKMVYNVENGVYKGSYQLHIEEWSLDYYMDPLEPTATWSDSTYAITDAIWTPSHYINSATFSVLFKGHETVKMRYEEAGVEKKNYTLDEADVYHTVDLKEYETLDSIPSIKVGDVTFYLVK